MKKKKSDTDQASQILLYQTEDGQTRLEVQLEKNTIWLSLNQMAVLFQRDKSVISKHIKNIFEEGELSSNSVVANFATTGPDGKTYQVDHLSISQMDLCLGIAFHHYFQNDQFQGGRK